MVCSVGIPAACMTPVSALLSPVSRDCGGGVTGPQRRQQQQTTADYSTGSNVLLLRLVWRRGPASGALACLPATDCFLVSLQLVLYQYWVTGLLRMLSSMYVCVLTGSLPKIGRAVSWNWGLNLISWVTMWSRLTTARTKLTTLLIEPHAASSTPTQHPALADCVTCGN